MLANQSKDPKTQLPCPHCYGTGSVEGPPRSILTAPVRYVCGKCKGTGTLALPTPQEEVGTFPCPLCKGEGRSVHKYPSGLVLGDLINTQTKIITSLLDALEAWAHEEDDCIFPESWDAYEEGCKLIGRPIKITTEGEEQGD